MKLRRWGRGGGGGVMGVWRPAESCLEGGE
jgi:hypothetical protein